MIDMKETLGNIVENVMDGIKKEKKIDKTKEFAELLVKCDLTTFLAMSKILCVPFKVQGAEDLRPFEELWSEVIDKFNSVGRSQKRQIIRLLKKVVK